MSETDYISKNKKSWNDRTPYHVTSAFYNVEGFMKGESSLKKIELDLLGDIKGKKILHLQCHFGMDTLSLARMGSQTTGVDFSEKAIEQARNLNTQLHLDAKFICCDIYDLPNHLNETFDIVFTSYGTVGWLPDMDKWAKVIAAFLKPGGQFIFADFHPVVWMYDYEFKEVTYNYFKDEPIIESESGTYADKKAPIQNETISWNHSISEVTNGLIKNGLTIQLINEYNYSPFSCFNDMVELEPGKFTIPHLGNKIPMVYALKTIK